MLLTETMGHERELEEEPEQFFAKYILTRAFENERGRRSQAVLKVGLVGPNTAYEIHLLKAADNGDDLFMVRVASYPSKGVEDWLKTTIFSIRQEAFAYVYYLRTVGVYTDIANR
jgi:hypothetical protein